MKIIDIQTAGVNLGDSNHIFVKVISDEHLIGIGEAYRVGPDQAVIEVIDYFKDWLVGEDPTRIEHLWRLLYNNSRFPGGSIVNAAISGIETALWDLKGKIHGLPVYQLLGGRCRDRVRVYLGVRGATIDELVADARDAVARGFTAIKLQPLPPDNQQLPWNQVLKQTQARMAAVRRAIGDDVDLALDPHARLFEPYRAAEIAEVVRPYRPLFFEEPIRPENIQAMAELHRRIDIPLATGEMLYTKYEFRDLIAAGAADIVQPDLVLCGGLLEGKKIAAMAEAHYLNVAPHNPLGPVSTAIAVQLAASTPNFLILEYRVDIEGPRRKLVKEPLTFDQGWLRIPETPGLGIELNEAAFRENPLTRWRRDLLTEPDGNIAFQ